MDHDTGVIYTLLEEFHGHLYPRALAMESKLQFGERLSADELEDLTEVIVAIRNVLPLVERHPEYGNLAGRVASLYASIVDLARRNEESSAPRGPDA